MFFSSLITYKRPSSPRPFSPPPIEITPDSPPHCPHQHAAVLHDRTARSNPNKSLDVCPLFFQQTYVTRTTTLLPHHPITHPSGKYNAAFYARSFAFVFVCTTHCAVYEKLPAIIEFSFDFHSTTTAAAAATDGPNKNSYPTNSDWLGAGEACFANRCFRFTLVGSRQNADLSSPSPSPKHRTTAT